MVCVGLAFWFAFDLRVHPPHAMQTKFRKNVTDATFFSAGIHPPREIKFAKSPPIPPKIIASGLGEV
jgi:hypothetical protein